MKYIPLACATALTLISALSSCSGSSKETIRQARILGKERALDLAPDNIGSDSVKIESIIIDVREREARLRSAGEDRAADAYIEGFLESLDSVNPSISAQLR